MRFLLRRLFRAIWLLAAVSLLSFVMLELAPGDFFTEMKLNPAMSSDTIAALRREHGLDAPLPVRYGRWLASVAHGEFGYSFAYDTPVSTLIWTRAVNTLILTVPATALAWTLAVALGVWTATRPGSWLDHLTGVASSALLTVPDLLITLLLLILALRTGWFPPGGMVSPGGHVTFAAALTDVACHAVLPVLALVLGIVPTLFRHVRASMIEALEAPAVQAARGHGLPRRRVLFRYALRLAANPLVSLTGFSLGNLLGASLLVEAILAWPGLGALLLEAVFARDVFIVIGAMVVSTAFLAAGNLVADVWLLMMDPRIRAA